MLLFSILKTPIQTLRNKGEFVFGTDSLASTMYELVLDSVMAQGYLYPYTSDVFYYVALLFLGIAIIAGGVLFFYLHCLPPNSPKEDFTTSVKVPLGGFRGLNNKNKENKNHDFPKIYFAGILLLLVLLAAFIVQYYLLDVKYLVGRKSVILIPLVSLPIYFLLENIYRIYNNKIAKLVLPMFFTLFFINHFERTSNLEKSVEWIYDAHTKEMIKYMKENMVEDNPTNLGVFWIFGPASEFYRQQFSLEENIQLKRIEEDVLSTTQEFSHIYIAKHQEGILPKTYKIEKRFGTSGILYRSTKQIKNE